MVICELRTALSGQRKAFVDQWKSTFIVSIVWRSGIKLQGYLKKMWKQVIFFFFSSVLVPGGCYWTMAKRTIIDRCSSYFFPFALPTNTLLLPLPNTSPILGKKVEHEDKLIAALKQSITFYCLALHSITLPGEDVHLNVFLLSSLFWTNSRKFMMYWTTYAL